MRENQRVSMTQDALLKLLETDARLSDAEIAERLGLSCEAVAARRAELEARGRIVGYQAVTNDDQEVGVSAFIEVKLTPERDGGFDRIAARIARFDAVASCYLASGGFDLLVQVDGETLMDVARFVAEKLSTMEGVLSTATHFRLKTYKKNGLLFESPSAHERLSVTP